MRLDHVIYATSDLNAGAARISGELGLQPAGGGTHEGLGTHNRIFPLGDGYLEVMAIADPSLAGTSDMATAIQSRVEAASEGLMAWCIEVDDLAGTAERLATQVVPISRDGLSAGMTGIFEAMATPHLPFFIHRDDGIADPGAGASLGFDWIELRGDEATLDERLPDRDGIDVRIKPGEPAVVAVSIGGRELRF